MDEQLLQRFSAAYPGQEFHGLHFFRTQATLSDELRPDAYIESILASAIRQSSFKLAGEAPAGMVVDGKPRMLKMTAWLCHADVINGNRYLFTDEDLRKVVADGVFQAPYFGMVDYNHDFSLYGVWYSAKYEFDPVANANGILAEGVLFAWRYSELADRMLAMQVRQGHIDVSVAVDPDHVIVRQDANGDDYLELAEPVFFGSSVLDVTPADKDARGLGSEDPEQPSEERELALKVSSDENDLTGRDIPSLEEHMDFEKLEGLIREALSTETREQLKPVFEAAQRVPGLENELATSEQSLAAANTRISELEAAVAEADTASEELRLAASTAQSALEAANVELEELRAFRSEVEAREQEEAEEELLTSRFAELSQNAQANFAQLSAETQEKLKERWKSLPQEEWDLVRQSLNGTAEPIGTYEAASRREGRIPSIPGSEPAGKFEIDKWF